MVKILVEIADEINATNISFKVEEEHPTASEELWERRLGPVLKNALNTAVALLGERAKEPRT
jgi:hypothetical protein